LHTPALRIATHFLLTCELPKPPNWILGAASWQGRDGKGRERKGRGGIERVSRGTDKRKGRERKEKEERAAIVVLGGGGRG